MGEHKRYAVFSLSIVMHYITPGYTSATYAAPEVLCFCLACAVVCQSRFPSYANVSLSIHKNTEWTLWNSQEVIITMKKLNYYIWAKLEQEQRYSIREKITID